MGFIRQQVSQSVLDGDVIEAGKMGKRYSKDLSDLERVKLWIDDLLRDSAGLVRCSRYAVLGTY